jgi:hypothetical protein
MVHRLARVCRPAGLVSILLAGGHMIITIGFFTSAFALCLLSFIKSHQPTVCNVLEIKNFNDAKRIRITVEKDGCSRANYFETNTTLFSKVPWTAYPCVQATSFLGTCTTWIGSFEPPYYQTPPRLLYIPFAWSLIVLVIAICWVLCGVSVIKTKMLLHNIRTTNATIEV